MKKLFAFLVTLITLLTASAFAADPDIAVFKPIGEPSKSGYQAYSMFDANGNKVEPAKRETPINLFADPLPAKYDSRDYGYITSVKDQGQFGTCWAHAFVACAEANMVKKGYEENFINYSELHLAYFYHKRNEEQGDGVDVFDSKNGYFGNGNGYYAAQFAENFQDLAVEPDFPYENISSSIDFSIDEKYRNHADVHMVNYGELTTIEDAKKAIMEYGAVSLGYCDINTSYLSPQFGYYQNKYTGTNHEVTVVGWDDNFPVENFNADCRPSKPGAWLIKNSWSKMYADFGYFWLSYEDPSIDLGCYYNFEPVCEENIVHTHNGGIAGLVWEVPVANVFEVTEDQTLTSIGFDAVTYNYVPEKYEIMIYVSNSKPNNPMSGTAKQTLKGDVPCDGFHKVSLDKPISLKKGQYLSVICILANSKNKRAASKFESGENYTSEPGESYIFYRNNWIDAHNYYISGFTLKNATIKAYAKSDVATVTFNTRQAEHFDTVKVKVGETIERPEDPIIDGYDFLGWYTNYTATEEWDFSQPVTKDMILFAKWSQPENIDLKVESEFFSKTYNPGVSLSANNIKNYTFYFAKNHQPYTYTATFDSSYLNSWRYWGLGTGVFEVFADIRGINGEEIITKSEYFTVTDQPAVSAHEGAINIVNIPPYGVDLYIAEYDDEGRFLGVQKSSHYRSYENNGTKIMDTKRIDLPQNLSNPRFFLWNAGETTPLCTEDSDL